MWVFLRRFHLPRSLCFLGRHWSCWSSRRPWKRGTCGPKGTCRNTCAVEELFWRKHRSLCLQGERGFDGIAGPKGTQGEKGERVRHWLQSYKNNLTLAAVCCICCSSCRAHLEYLVPLVRGGWMEHLAWLAPRDHLVKKVQRVFRDRRCLITRFVQRGRSVSRSGVISRRKRTQVFLCHTSGRCVLANTVVTKIAFVFESSNTKHMTSDWSTKSAHMYSEQLGPGRVFDCCRLLHDYSEDGVLCVWRAHLHQVEKQHWWQPSSIESLSLHLRGSFKPSYLFINSFNKYSAAESKINGSK